MLHAWLGPEPHERSARGGGTLLQTEARRDGSRVLRGWQAVRRASRPRGGAPRLHVVIVVVVVDDDDLGILGRALFRHGVNEFA